MGTITIEQYTTAGGRGAVDGAPVVNLSTCIKTTVDSTTSTTPESITLHPDTNFIVVSAEEDHCVSLKDSTVEDKYGLIRAGREKDYAVNGADRTLYYRLNA